MCAESAIPAEVEVAIVGAGFSGLAVAERLRRAGRNDFVLLERGADVGGTWRDNSYPGCRCDVPSHLYSFGSAPNPDWTSTYSAQPEIQDYLRRFASERGLLPHIRLGCELESARWDSLRARWDIRTSRGGIRARVLVSAAGPLSDPVLPDLPGLESFRGECFHSAAWNHSHALDGRRVAVIGTGASAIQFVPEIQPRVARLVLFQRTPPWVLPHRDRPIRAWERRLYRRAPLAQRVLRGALYWGRELYAVPMVRARLSGAIAWLGRRHLNRQVSDPELRRRLTPDYAPGCKRLLLSNTYYPALTRANVEVVTAGIAEVRPHSIVTRDGAQHAVDTIIFGTGFRVTDPPIAERVVGAGGRSLAAVWDGSLEAHRGSTVAGFPNLFLMLGPNTGLGHTSVVLMAEAQARYVLGALEHMDRAGIAALEPTAAAQETWNRRVQAAMAGTVWTAGGCASWYLDRHGRNTTLWPRFAFQFQALVSRFDAANYAAPAPAPRTGRRSRVALG